VEFRFEPRSYKTANTLMLISTLIVYLLLIAAIVLEVRNRKSFIAR
jgi:hypothetical protein